jgi:hypothetical protein
LPRNWNALLLATTLALAGGLPGMANITLHWGEQNGPDNPPIPYFLDAGTLSFTLPPNETITGAVFSSTFGNSTVYSTAAVDVYVNNLLVGSCPGAPDPCFTGTDGDVVPFSYAYTQADLATLASGAADLTITQNSPLFARLGDSTLLITTTPEPALAVPLLLILSAAVLIGRRRVAEARARRLTQPGGTL